MARKRFSRRTTRQTKRKIKPDDVNSVIQKDFIDSRGNKIRFRFDFAPHSINDPTFSIQRDYGDE